jgi:hypothetical protein
MKKLKQKPMHTPTAKKEVGKDYPTVSPSNDFISNPFGKSDVVDQEEVVNRREEDVPVSARNFPRTPYGW